MHQKKLNQLSVRLNEIFSYFEEVESEEILMDSELLFSSNKSQFFKLQECRFQEILSIIHNSLAIKDFINQNSLKDEVNSLIRLFLSGESKIDENAISDLLNSIMNKFPKEDWVVFRNLYGARLTLDKPLELGSYKIYKEEAYQEIVDSRLIPSYISKLDSSDKNKLIISVDVPACDAITALSLADHKFHQFDNLIRYMLSSSSGAWDVGVFDYLDTGVLKSVAISETRYQSNSSVNGVMEIVSLDTNFPGQIRSTNQEILNFFSNQIFFNNTNSGHAWIWHTVNDPNKNEVQSRIISAVEWIGKSLRDSDISRAFVQLVFALEVLFTFQERNVLVSPSIANQIAEFSAFILKNDFDGRSNVEKTIKRIYAKRSAIAHGGSSIVSRDEYNEALSLIRQLILKLTTQNEFLALTSIDELNTWVKRKKFS